MTIAIAGLVGALVFVSIFALRGRRAAKARLDEAERSRHAANQQLQQLARDSAHAESAHRAQLTTIRADLDTLADDLETCETREARRQRIARLRDHTETRTRNRHG